MASWNTTCFYYSRRTPVCFLNTAFSRESFQFSPMPMLYPQNIQYIYMLLLITCQVSLFVTLFNQHSTNEPTSQHTVKQLILLTFNYVFFLLSHLPLIQVTNILNLEFYHSCFFYVYVSTFVYIYTREQPLTSLLSTTHCFLKKSPDTNFVTLCTLHLESMLAINYIKITNWFLRHTSLVAPLFYCEFKDW